MITLRQPAPAAAPPLEIDIVKILARHMSELEAQGVIVTRDALLRVTDFTAAEIDRHAADAADLARMSRRQAA